MVGDPLQKRPDGFRFEIPETRDNLDLGTVTTDERIVISGNDQVIFAKRLVEEPIRVGPPLESRLINVVRQGRTV